jgi:putative ABC transport system permease protein
MFRNYLKIAWRNLWKHKLFTAINVFGLASGLMVCMVMLTHLKGAFDYDNFHPNHDRIYRILTDATDRGGNRASYATSPLRLADDLPRDYPFVEKATRIVRVYGNFYNKQARFDNVLAQAVDPSFYAIFGYPLAQGRPATELNTAVITHETALKFFGTANPLGQTLQHDQLGHLTVVGVLADPQPHSHQSFDLLATTSFEKPLFQAQRTDWQDPDGGYTYLLLNPKTDAQTLQTALTSVSKRLPKYSTGKVGEKQIAGLSLRAQALSDISPATEMLRNDTYEPDQVELTIEMAVGLLMLLLAGFNYINLTLARSANRAREVGIRKVVGALRWQVMGQFVAEAMVLSLLAMGLAYVMLLIISPMPSIQTNFMGGVEQDVRLWGLFIGFSLLTGLVAGLLPAKMLSGFEIATVLRSSIGLKTIRGVSLRKALIVAQFTLTLIAAVFIFTMLRQQHFMATADYGFRRAGVLTLPLHNVPNQRYINAIAPLSGVEHLALTSIRLGDHGGDYYNSVRQRQSAPDSMGMFVMGVNSGFLPTMGLTLLAGQNLPPSTADSVGRLVVINEKAAHKLGFSNARAAVGQRFWLTDQDELAITGIVKDFQHTTLKWELMPLILRYEPVTFRYLNVAVVPGQEAALLAQVRRIWEQLNPHQPFTGQWYDDYLNERHRHTDDTNILLIFIGLSLSIACLGMFGMVTYQSEIRTKEVGIRKVMGATVTQIVALLSWDFVKLLLIAAAIALPIGYQLSTLMLSEFAHHVSVGIETLGTCVVLLVLIGGLTIGWRTRQAAQANPVESLRTE